MPSSAPPRSLLGTLLRHYDDLVDHIRRRFGDPHLARDVVQDVSLRLLEQAPTEPIQTPLALLRRMSTHLAIDHYRATQVRDRWQQAQMPLSTADDSDPSAELAATQLQARLLAAIRALPPRCQEVFILAALHDEPQHVIATQLGISRTMVARHLQKARAALQVVADDTRESA